MPFIDISKKIAPAATAGTSPVSTSVAPITAPAATNVQADANTNTGTNVNAALPALPEVKGVQDSVSELPESKPASPVTSEVKSKDMPIPAVEMTTKPAASMVSTPQTVSMSNPTKVLQETNSAVQDDNTGPGTSAPPDAAAQIREIKGPEFEKPKQIAAQLDVQSSEPVSLGDKLTEVKTNLSDVASQVLPSQPAAMKTEPVVSAKPMSQTPKPEESTDTTKSTMDEDIVLGTEKVTETDSAPEVTIDKESSVDSSKPEEAKDQKPPTPPAPEPPTMDIKMGTDNTPASESTNTEHEEEPLKPAVPEMPMPEVKKDEPLPPVQPSQPASEIKSAPDMPKVVTPDEASKFRSKLPALPSLIPAGKPSELPAEPMPKLEEPPMPVESQNLSARSYSLDEILREAVKMGASDVHINVGYRAMARVDGRLIPMRSHILDPKSVREMLVAVAESSKGLAVGKDKDIDLAYHLDDLKTRFRVNIYQEKDNLAGVFRLIPQKIKTIEELKLPPIIRQFTDLEQGLILVTGSTGSGKSTTIAALINEINLRKAKHIVTIEDPIEYIYPTGMSIVSQRGMGEDTNSWKESLRSVLRQDPDIVLIGEMRDLETIATTMTLAETGHLVFATLHTNSATQSIDRIIDVFPEHQQNQIRTQLANVLTAVVSQKLVPISGGGRRVAMELMITNSAVKAAIREGKVHTIDNIIQTSAEQGMLTVESSLISLIREGLITPELAQQYANRPADLVTLLVRS